MTVLRVTPGQLEALGSVTNHVSAEVRGQHQALRTRLSPLFGADWAGPASARFANLYEQFDQHARGLGEALDGIGALLMRAGTTYEQAEAGIAASFGP